ncbi:efflux RND transporter periplasmic adaptor subunit [Lutibacter sp. A80]|uniref:efflux RND transporter periplasmic adaptor subunit n=1 Tax=Lutibacter sp. A80 TaxID=2918453 RepID=UPI001F063B74|nr:HlyD family efflux transporter periplasmic adaptor subunit [Lutibacter sp. A80]UMB61442.1 efflux RND transporter periplasmic adaptor subunit [Lutibacter sp. A80]
MRKTIITIGSLLLIALSIIGGIAIVNNNKKGNPTFNKIVSTVYTKTITNSAIPVVITTSGSLTASNKIELYSEVQGILKTTSKDFKEGTEFAKNEAIISINSDEFYANLKAQKSNLFNVITAIMPDIQLDYPNEYQKWKSYLNNFDINKPIPKLPETNSEKEKFFISGRGIITTYYNVKNLEVKHGKYTLRAPFKGILTEVMVTQGSLVRSGQKLGEFIDPSVYEMEVNINQTYANLLKKGNTVSIYSQNKDNVWEATVIRVNGKVDQTTQTVKAFLQVKGEQLREGMYLTADLETKSIENAVEVSRQLLVEDTKLFIVKDSTLNLVTINPAYYNDHTVIVQGLENGTNILSKPLPGAYNGMLVKTINETTNNQ